MDEPAIDGGNVVRLDDLWEDALKMARVARGLADVVEREATLRLYGSSLAQDVEFQRHCAEIDEQFVSATDADLTTVDDLYKLHGIHR
jgi:hypothetical protein